MKTVLTVYKVYRKYVKDARLMIIDVVFDVTIAKTTGKLKKNRPTAVEWNRRTVCDRNGRRKINVVRMPLFVEQNLKPVAH